MGLDCDLRWVEVLILVGFDDIGCDIWIFVVKVSEMLDFTWFLRKFVRVLKN